MTYTEIIKTLKKAGFKISSKETTPGARKAWFTFNGEGDRLEVAWKALGCPGKIEKGFVDSSFRGLGYTVEKQSYAYDDFDGIYLAYYLRRPKGNEYRMGIDC